jgi:hypothetical protein
MYSAHPLRWIGASSAHSHRQQLRLRTRDHRGFVWTTTRRNNFQCRKLHTILHCRCLESRKRDSDSHAPVLHRLQSGRYIWPESKLHGSGKKEALLPLGATLDPLEMTWIWTSGSGRARLPIKAYFQGFAPPRPQVSRATFVPGYHESGLAACRATVQKRPINRKQASVLARCSRPAIRRHFGSTKCVSNILREPRRHSVFNIPHRRRQSAVHSRPQHDQSLQAPCHRCRR